MSFRQFPSWLSAFALRPQLSNQDIQATRLCSQIDMSMMRRLATQRTIVANEIAEPTMPELPQNRLTAVLDREFAYLDETPHERQQQIKFSF